MEPIKEKLEKFVQNVEDNTNDTLMDEYAKEENFNTNYTEIVKNSYKDKMSKLPWLMAIFLILIIALALGLMFFKNNPKTLFTSTVDSLFNYFKSNINENVYDITDGNVELDYTIKSSENKELYDELSRIKWQADYVKDNTNTYIELKAKYDNEDFISANIYSDSKNTYVYSSSIYDKYLKLGNNKLNYFASGKDINIVLSGLNQAIDKVIADEKIYGKKEDKNYKMRFTVNDKNRDRVAETFVNTLKSNDEFISVLAKMRDQKSSDIKKSLDNYLPKLKNFLVKNDKLDVLIYVNNKTKEFIKADVSGNLGTINLTKNDDGYTYSIVKKDDYTINGEFSFNVNDSKTKYDIKFSHSKLKDNVVIDESNINLKFTSKKATSFKKIDVSDSASLDEMSEIEKFKIYTKILTDSKFIKLIDVFKMI